MKRMFRLIAFIEVLLVTPINLFSYQANLDPKNEKAYIDTFLVFNEVSDLWLLKTDSTGDTLWTRTYGGQYADVGNSVCVTPDAGYIITGLTSSFGSGLEDLWVLRTDHSGETLWTRTYGGSGIDRGYSIQSTSDGNYIITGWTNFSPIREESDIWLLKIKPNGDTLWTQTYGIQGEDKGYHVQQTSDGGYILIGSTRSLGAGLDDITGDTLWTRAYGMEWHDRGYYIEQTSDAGYIIIGSRWIPGQEERSSDVWLLKTDSLGDTIWTRTYGGSQDWRHEEGFFVTQTIDGGYIFAYGIMDKGYSLVKTDSTGNIAWQKFYSKLGIGSLQETSDGGYIITGSKSNDLLLLKIDCHGKKEWRHTYGRKNLDVGLDIRQTQDQGFIVVGARNAKGIYPRTQP
jgi:hypothetical protein